MPKTPQELAIEKVQGPCLVMAGAGTGKTYTIVHKVAHLINTKVCNASEILCLTFSNEATNNLRKQIGENVAHANDVTIRTFHGFCSDILKELGPLIKIDPGFDILEPDDAVVWFYRYLDISPYYADLYAKSISTATDFGISFEQIKEHTEKLKKILGDIKDPEEYAEKLELERKLLHLKTQETAEQKKRISARKKEINEFLSNYYEYSKYKGFIEAWTEYNELKKDKNVLDFADLNAYVLDIFGKYGAEKISSKYKYVVIDEFQDTNKQQFELIEFLAPHRNITIVGDVNQSIYGFRGAYRQNFEHFKESFKVNNKTDLLTVDKSRRSPNTVLRTAHKLIKNNYENPKECFLVENYKGIEGEKVRVIELKKGSEEARKIAEIAEEEIEKGTPLNEICILHRTHQQSVLIRQALEAKNIPLITAGRINLLRKPEIKTVIAYLSILNNLLQRTGTGEQAWWDLFHYKNALTPEDSVKIGRFLKSKRDDELSIDQAALNHLDSLDLSFGGKKIVGYITSRLKELLKVSNKALPDLVLDIYEIVGLNRAFTHARNIHNVEALMNLRQFHDISIEYYEKYEKTLSGFIDYIEVLDILGTNIQASKITDINALRLMTMHAVKGLEFKTVIVTNLAEKRFPIERTAKEPLIPKELNPDIKRHLQSIGNLTEEQKEDAIKDYERQSLLWEERRLCYVVFTRAKENLIITFARSYDEMLDSNSNSMFLDEIEFRNNKDIAHIKDDDEKCTIFAPCSRFEQFKSLLKQQLVSSLDTDDFPHLLSRVVAYHAAREGKIEDYAKMVDWKEIVDKKELATHIKACDKCSCLAFEKSNFTFSPTALLVYDECPKRYELSQIFQMPERGEFGFGAKDTGSFVHKVFETGVREHFKSKDEFIKLATQMAREAEWEGLDLEDANGIITVFWERHKNRYNEKSRVEEWLNVEIEGFKFVGKADRIDFFHEKDVEIIDYKTNNSAIDPKKRSWQLGFYAIAARKKLKLNPVKLTLEMLRLEKPYEATVDKDGNVLSGRSKGFNINDVEKELVECAKKIVHDYESEFLPAEDENACRFCGYKFYCPKWDEG